MKHKNNHPTVTILVPALNEETNIRHVLTDLLAQRSTGVTIEHIIVISDGSDDDTVRLAKTFPKPVSVKAYKDRKGKAYRLAQAFSRVESDIIVVVDADQRIPGHLAIQHIADEYTASESVAMVCAYVRPAPQTTTLINRVANFGYAVWDRARKRLGIRGTRYFADGACISYKTAFAKQIKFPLKAKYIDDDSYSYYSCVKLGYSVALAKQAISYMKLPETFKDYRSQMVRYLNADTYSKQSFESTFIDSQNTMTRSLQLRALAYEFLLHPLTGTAYICVQLYTKWYAARHKPNTLWSQASSTK